MYTGDFMIARGIESRRGRSKGREGAVYNHGRVPRCHVMIELQNKILTLQHDTSYNFRDQVSKQIRPNIC